MFFPLFSLTLSGKKMLNNAVHLENLSKLNKSIIAISISGKWTLRKGVKSGQDIQYYIY